MHAHAHRTFLAALALFVSIGAALAQPPATESGFVDVEDDGRLCYQRFGTGTNRL
jgi:hypothetical protein